MGKQWEAMDLKGGGLQAAEIAYKSVARTRLGAYMRWVLFPLGLHRFYLLDRWGGLAYLAASLSALAVHLAAGFPWLWLIPGIAALADLFWIPSRQVKVNKELRLQTMMSSSRPGAPRGFKGHYTDESSTGDEEGTDQ